MAPSSPPRDKKKDGDQFGRFVETARSLGCDEDKERFENKLGKIASAKPAQEPKRKLKKAEKKK
jgi:hypothetical protein